MFQEERSAGDREKGNHHQLHGPPCLVARLEEAEAAVDPTKVSIDTLVSPRGAGGRPRRSAIRRRAVMEWWESTRGSRGPAARPAWQPPGHLPPVALVARPELAPEVGLFQADHGEMNDEQP